MQAADYSFADVLTMTFPIVGAGPGMGLAIARTFGTRGFDVALIARNRAKLDDLVAQLGADGISAAAFPADVLDRDALTQALKDAAAHFDGIDVLEYSPVGGLGSTVLTSPSETDPSDVQHELEFQLYGPLPPLGQCCPRCGRPTQAPCSTPPAPARSTPSRRSPTSTPPLRRCGTG
jgi:NAD(P)-dependent dehydrogenase (short-subunit alcohol dehydrogenase family)